jgi:ribokinase
VPTSHLVKAPGPAGVPREPRSGAAPDPGRLSAPVAGTLTVGAEGMGSMRHASGHSSPPRIAVVGEANTDFVIRGPRLPAPGQSVDGWVFLEAPGGKGLNQAVAAARLGAAVDLVARIGDDRRGHAIREHLAREGVGARYVVRDAVATTGAALVQVEESGRKQTIGAPGANCCLDVHDVRRAGPRLRAATILLVQLQPPLPAIAEAVRIAKAAGALVILDAAPPRPLPDELLRGLAVIHANAVEAEALTGLRVTDRRTARRAAAVLLERGARAAAIEAGARGDLIAWRDGECWLPRLRVRPVDETGAGDAFVAALAVQLGEGRGLADAGRFANAAAALTTTRLGVQASLPRRDAVMALLERLRRGRRTPLVAGRADRSAAGPLRPRCAPAGRRTLARRRT